MGLLSNILQHPLTRGLDLDDPDTTCLRRQIIQEKPLLKNIYEEWYRTVCNHLPHIEGPVLEIGSGAGFLETFIPKLITSDIMPVSGNNIACNAQHIPFKDKCLRAIVLINVLHHISNPLLFFKNSERCVKKGGRIIMVEPWVSSWSRIIYGKLHHEPFDPANPSWTLPQTGPLSGGNHALPWIIFQRDRERFNQQTNWQIHLIKVIMPFRYLLSGGVSMRNLLPAWIIRPLTFLEKSMSLEMMKKTAMFAIVVLCRKKV
jgi:SAM-dependent methyltransferase